MRQLGFPIGVNPNPNGHLFQTFAASDWEENSIFFQNQFCGMFSFTFFKNNQQTNNEKHNIFFSCWSPYLKSVARRAASDVPLAAEEEGGIGSGSLLASLLDFLMESFVVVMSLCAMALSHLTCHWRLRSENDAKCRS